MSSVQIEQKSYEMPPREGISIAQFLTVADIERSARYYEKVFGARILSLGDCSGGTDSQDEVVSKAGAAVINKLPARIK
jgi:predicted enzyme related to lactoylglutathione lyase